MKFFILTAVLAACAVSSLGTAVASDGSVISKRSLEASECCPCLGLRCGDNTGCTPYCGYGPCNFLGCNCDGGCRRGLGSAIIESEMHSLESSKSYLEASEASEYFDITDANKDGIVTIHEWLDSPVRSTSGSETCSMLVKQWAKFDTANVGYLTKHQAINRKA